MNTVQAASTSQEKINNLIRSQKIDKRKEAEVSADKSANQANKVKNKEQSSLASKKNSGNENANDSGKDKLEVNDYLKIVSRLENKLNLGELEDEDLDKISLSLEEKILSLSDVQKTRLRNLAFFKEKGIENIKDLKKTLFELFKDVDERESLFRFLKSPEFMSMLLNESDKPFTYSPPGSAKMNTSTKIPV